MGQKFSELSEKLMRWIQDQHLFFVGTAAPGGRVNVSPKGLDSLRVLSETRVVWLNLTGSGNETAAHLLENDRMTIMFCAFAAAPMILRLYGYAKVVHPRDAEWQTLCAMFPDLPGARQIFDLSIDLVQTSCGKGVPLLGFTEDRDQLLRSAEKKGEAGIREYWATKNQTSLDGQPTGILPT